MTTSITRLPHNFSATAAYYLSVTPGRLEVIARKTAKIAGFVILLLAASYINATLAFVGIAVGFFAPEFVSEKIQLVWRALWTDPFFSIPTGILGFLIFMPQSLSAMSFALPAFIGARIRNNLDGIV